MHRSIDTDEPNTQPPFHVVGAYKAWRLARAYDFPADIVWMCAPEKSTSYRHRILPLGEPSIAVRRRRDGRGHLVDAKLIICGPHERACWHHSSEADELIAVRLKPELAVQLFAIEPAAYKNLEVTAAPRAVIEHFPATKKVMSSQHPIAVAKAMLEDVASVAATNDISLGIEHAAAAALRTANGEPKIREIAAKLSISERQLRRRFRDSVGCSPKDYARRLRVAHAAILADAVERPNWAMIASETGFHDQAHMITAFKALSGLTPGALHRERKSGTS